MKALIRILLLSFALALFASAPRAQALTLPSFGMMYLTGSTTQLQKIRAAIDKVAGFSSASWTPPYPETSGHVLSAPWGLGAIDCMYAYYVPEATGMFDGINYYLGMSVELNGEIIEIPAFEDIYWDTDPATTLPGACYGYLFHTYCVATGPIGPMLCADP